MKTVRVSKSKLQGKVKLSGAKNSSLRLLAASLLSHERFHFHNFPNGLLDVQVHLDMLKALGKEIDIINNDELTISETAPQTILKWEGRSIRNTLLILGALVARLKKGGVPLPGGCKLGERKYDLHVMLLERLGAKVWEEDGYLFAEAKNGLKGAEIFLPFRSTGATENAIICGSLAKGKTTVWNPHIRPEILDLISLLNKMGAKIKVFGQKCIEIEGVNELSGSNHTVIPDNMEALTWAIGATITNGEVEIENFPYEHLEVPMIFLRESGMKYFKGKDSIIISGGTPYPIDISTGPYPGINSDMQPLFAVYGAMSQGESKIIDLRFPGRYGYVEEMKKMGLDYSINGEMLSIKGGGNYSGNTVTALDLRAGIALMLLGFCSEGQTEIENAWQIARGYNELSSKLKSLNGSFEEI